MDTDLNENKIHLQGSQIRSLANRLQSDEEKHIIIKIYQFDDYTKFEILKTCSNGYKLDILLNDESFSKMDILNLAQSFDAITASKLLAEHKEFCDNKGITPSEILQGLDTLQQKEFIANLDNINLTLSAKREILASLSDEIKQSIDTTNFPEEYKSALSMKTTIGGRIVLDLERDLEDYRGLDNLLKVNPEEFTEEQRTKLMKLCDICPNMKIFNKINSVTYYSSPTEYKKAEEWISSIIDSLNPEYSKAQKMALIDNAIGKKISYSPDFDTEVFEEQDSGALWKIINSGYGVCKGISTIEKYILSRVGIESEIINSATHSFLKIKDIELPLANGKIAKGNTILDPTWNLVEHRFDAKPNLFCVNYEQARKKDIDFYGEDRNCHNNDKKLQDATLTLDDLSLIKLFISVGLTDENGRFRVKDLIEKSELIDKTYKEQPEENIKQQLLLLKEVCPEFATCQNSSMSILSLILLNNKNLDFNKCVVNRVYNRTDPKKKPILYVYIDSNELGKRFYFADKDEGQFVELTQEEFTKKFECYETDLQKSYRYETVGKKKLRRKKGKFIKRF